jgi:hypothetical protein
MLEARGEGLFMSVGESKFKDGTVLELAVILFGTDSFTIWKNQDVEETAWQRLKSLAPGTPVQIRGTVRQDGGKVKFRLLDVGAKAKAA